MTSSRQNFVNGFNQFFCLISYNISTYLIQYWMLGFCKLPELNSSVPKATGKVLQLAAVPHQECMVYFPKLMAHVASISLEHPTMQKRCNLACIRNGKEYSTEELELVK